MLIQIQMLTLKLVPQNVRNQSNFHAILSQVDLKKQKSQEICFPQITNQQILVNLKRKLKN